MHVSKKYTLNTLQKWKCLKNSTNQSVSFAAKSYNVRIDGERPVIAAPTANTSPQNNNVFKCPKKVWLNKVLKFIKFFIKRIASA